MKNEFMKSTTKKMHWWSKLKSPFVHSKKEKWRKDEKDEDTISNKLNVNEEYKEVFRTKSYTEIWSKVQFQLQRSSIVLDRRISSFSSPPSWASSSSNCPSTSSPFSFHMHFFESLLEPRQEAVNDLIKGSNLQSLLIDYFEASLEACNICELILRGIHKTRSNHLLIERVIKLSRGGEERAIVCLTSYMNEQCRDMIIKDLTSFTRLKNPMSSIINGKMDFPKIHDKYDTLLQNLISKRSKIKRKQKFTKFYKKAAGYGFVITYSVLVVTMLTLAINSIVGMLGLPGLLLAFPLRAIKKGSDKEIRVSFLDRLASQLDVAARGVYILINDFDTVGRLVRRLHDEVEHTRELAEICARNKKSQEVMKEALKELHLHEEGFVEQLDELEEHIYLCFLTINRSRRLVIQEILSP